MKGNENPISRMTGDLNIALGFTGLFLAALGGFALGITFDNFAVQNGEHVLTLGRFFLREGHSHGMPIALYNLIIGIGLQHGWVDGSMADRIASIGAAVGFLLPIGLILRSLAGPNLAPIGMLGALGLLASFVTCLISAWKRLLSR
jgi:hypothetical protein